jgi:type II secretory pathway pseudopilin PulG
MELPMLIGKLPKSQSGFTYLTILFAIAVAGVVLSNTGVDWWQAAQREKERELQFVGNQYRQAIAQYYERTPGAVKRYPAKLEDLLADTRYNPPQRYLRKLYRDPVLNQKKWGIVPALGGGIMGVHSLSDVLPIKSSNFSYADQAFEGKTKYSDWQFIYTPLFSPTR